MTRSDDKRVRPSDVIVVGARMTDEVLAVVKSVEQWWSDQLADRDRTIGSIYAVLHAAIARAEALEAEVNRLQAALRVNPADVEMLCHWHCGERQPDPPKRQSHREYHFGFECPYHVIAEIMRGNPDPRDQSTHPCTEERPE
jgi:hypothetical protein